MAVTIAPGFVGNGAYAVGAFVAPLIGAAVVLAVPGTVALGGYVGGFADTAPAAELLAAAIAAVIEIA